MSRPDKESTRKAVVHWMDTMKEHLDHYEVHRNEFLSDMRLPPRNVKFLREVLLPFCENTLLLDNIAKSEGLCYEPGGLNNRLRIIVRVERDGKMEKVETQYNDLVDINGNNGIGYPDKFPYLLKHAGFDTNPKDHTLAVGLNGKVIKAGGNECDFEICLPHEHAFYSILENVIRNSAKHNAGKFKLLNASGVQGQPNGKAADGEDQLDTLDIHVDITDAGADHWHCTIYDNVSQVRHGVAETGAERMADLTDMLERKNKPLLADGKPNRANMGMADMKINAFLLKSARDFSEDDLNEALDFVICDRCTDGGHEHTVVRLSKEKQLKKIVWDNGKEVEQDEPEHRAYFFGYRFKLTKTKKVAWIGEAAQGMANDENYKRAGIYGYATWANYIESLCDGLAAYEIAVLEKEVWEEIQGKDGAALRGNLARLPFRVLVNAPNDEMPRYKRRVCMVAGLQCSGVASMRDELIKAWLRKKHDLVDDKKIHVRAVFLATDSSKPPAPINSSVLSAAVAFYNDKNEITLPDATGAQNVDIKDASGRLVNIDHHGNLYQAQWHMLNGNEVGNELAATWNRRKNMYSFLDKGSRDLEPLRKIFSNKDKELPLGELMLLADRLLTRILVVDERFSLMSPAALPNAHPKVTPLTSWGLWAAANVYVVTHLAMNDGKEPKSLSLAPDATKLTLSVGDDVKACIEPGTSKRMVDGKEETEKEFEVVGIEAMQGELTEEIDILLMHRTHWRNYSLEEQEKLMEKFPEVVIVSGAGRPDDLGSNKFISLSTLSAYLSSGVVSKAGLSTTLHALVNPDPKPTRT